MGWHFGRLVLVSLVTACSAPAAETAHSVPPVLRCDSGTLELPIVPLPLVAPRETPTPGQMTEEAVQAKRLFDGNRWSEAAAALARVEDGSTGDDAGNREIAQYQLAIALRNDRRRTAALEVFLKIAADHNHNKWRETLLWLPRFVGPPETSEQALRGMALYLTDAREEMAGRFGGPQNASYAALLNLMVGKVAYRNRDYDAAIEIYQGVRVGGEVQAAAAECIAAARAQLAK